MEKQIEEGLESVYRSLLPTYLSTSEVIMELNVRCWGTAQSSGKKSNKNKEFPFKKAINK